MAGWRIWFRRLSKGALNWDIYIHRERERSNLHTVKFTLLMYNFMSFDKWIQLYNYLQNQCIFQFHHSKKSSCVPLLSIPSFCLQSLAITDQFLISTVLPLPESHMHGIIQYVGFRVWLLSHRVMHLRFVHVVPCVESLFLFVAE